jgi:hypothetical protein
VIRFLIFATVASVGLSLAPSYATAEEPQEGSSTPTIETTQNTVVPVPTTTHRKRLSTLDRWRGRPYVRSTADENLRSRALDMALPPANEAFQGGGSLGAHAAFASEHAIRAEALDFFLPPANSAFGGGGGTAGLGF